MRNLGLIIICLLVLLLLAACETLTKIATTVGRATGELSAEEAEAIEKSAAAVAKSFEDITPEQEYYIGRAVGANVLDRYAPWPDQKINDYLNLLGQSLAMASDKPETFGGYHFLMLDSEEINAFAAPGGLIFVSKGMIRITTDEDTLAAVLAHEVAHVSNEHGLKSIQTARLTTALTSVAITAASVATDSDVAKLTAVFEDSITDITSTMINSGYSRATEEEADRSAVQILKRVGYDPRALIELLEVMAEKLEPGGIDFSKTHPDPNVRLDVVKNEIGNWPQAGRASGPRQDRYAAALAGL